MNEKLSQKVIDRMALELRLIHELVEDLVVDDIENDIRNAERCLREEGRTLEIENIAKNRMYHDGQNHKINEIREILGLPRLYLKGEKERIERASKDYYAGRQMFTYDCPPLEDSNFLITDGSAKFFSLGEDGDTYVVIGTKSARKAYTLMKRYEVNECGLSADEGISEEYRGRVEELPRGRIVWRKDESDSDYEYYYSWSDKDTKNNPKAVDCFIVSF